ncbi:hypothetical protein CLIB1444_11S02740 [[Candida] jaroonii]|uniref:Uncharacterized protein n=1 Tax=[Candida] jaroonii TaxID=467808 RepID=A0ACA9YCR3_9ASCO|nr:hypothetical protein CLIB1444_11S02740 [[Candida] jaroonii]
MFKKFFPLSRASSSKSPAVSKDSSSSNPSGESEIVSKSEIPTLLRRHSFALPSSQIGDIEVSEQSIDPFDKVNTLRRSRSLQLEIPKPLPVLIRESKSPKAVKFNDEDKLKSLCWDGRGPSLQDESYESQTSNYTDDNIETFKKNKVIPFKGDSLKEVPSKGEPVTTIQEATKKFDENIHWLDEVAHSNNSLKLNKLNIEYSLNESPNSEPHNETNKMDLHIYEQDNSTVTESHDETTNEEISSLKGLTSFEQSSPKKTWPAHEFIHILENLIHEVDPSKTYEDFENTGGLIFSQVLHRLRNYKSVIEQKDLDICQLTKSNQQLTKTVEELSVQLHQQGEIHENTVKLQELNTSLATKIRDTEYKLHDKIIQNTSLTNKIHQLETKIILMEVDNENNTTRLNKIYDIFQDKVGMNDQDGLEDHLIKVFDDHENHQGIIIDLKNEIETLHDANSELQNQTTRYKEFNEVLINENDNFKQQINDVILEKDLQIMGKELELENVNGELQQCSCQLQSAGLQVLERESALKHANEEIFELQSYNLQLESKINEVEDELGVVQNHNESLQNELNVKVVDNKLYKNELQGLKQSSYIEVKEKMVVINQLKQTIDNKNMELGDMNTSINNLKMEVMDKANLINNLTLQLSRLYQDNQFLQETKNDAHTKLSCVQNDLETVTKSFKEVNGIIKDHEHTNQSLVHQLNQYVKSNEILHKFFISLLMNLKAKLKPMMYNESINYMTEIVKPCKMTKIYNDGHHEMFKEITNFTTKAVSDLVENYLEMEKVLQQELEQKSANYNNMLNDLSQIMLANLSKSKTEAKPTHKSLPKYLNETYVKNV